MARWPCLHPLVRVARVERFPYPLVGAAYIMTYRPTTEKLPVKTRRCPTCRQPIVTGFDDAVGPTVATVDPHPLTLEGELLALVAGRATYGISEGFELGYRDAWRIEHLPPEPRGYTVHATHKCGTPPFPHYPFKKKTKRPKTERPPF